MSSYNVYKKELDDLYFNMLEYFNFEKEFTSNLPKNYISSFIICLVDAEEIENCIQIKLDDGNDELILIKFENKTTRNNFKDLINKKIMTSSNDERLLFSQFFEELIRKYRINENNNNLDEDDDF